MTTFTHKLIELSARIDHAFARARNQEGEFAPANGGEAGANPNTMVAAYGPAQADPLGISDPTGMPGVSDAPSSSVAKKKVRYRKA